MRRTLIRSWTKDDFVFDWFSGSGAGGQHRNKHQNCLRLTEKESGITVTAQSHRSRKQNTRDAMVQMAARLMDHYYPQQRKERAPITEVIRTYNVPDNRVTDHLTGNQSQWNNYEIDEDIELRIRSMVNG